jgi:hypothetical protein
MLDITDTGRKAWGKQIKTKGAKEQKFSSCKNSRAAPRIFTGGKFLLLLFVMDRGELDDLEETRAIGRLYFNFITFFFVEQALADRR